MSSLVPLSPGGEGFGVRGTLAMPDPVDELEFARQLREGQTFAEARLWEMLRGRRMGGFKFRRQRPIGPYFADFCCLEAKLIVQLDGDSHLGREAYDEARTDYLRDQGWYVLRFENFEVRLDDWRVASGF